VGEDQSADRRRTEEEDVQRRKDKQEDLRILGHAMKVVLEAIEEVEAHKDQGGQGEKHVHCEGETPTNLSP
jgi:hypothetical protein